MPTNQSAGIYVHGEQVTESPVHGGLVPTHGGLSPIHGSDNSVQTLAASLTLAASGPGITLTAPDASGRYRVVTDPACTASSFISSSAPISGDYLMEIQIMTHVSGAFAGTRNSVPAGGSSASLLEALFPDAGFGANKMNYTKSGSFIAQNLSASFANPFFLERVGGVENIRTGATWDQARRAIALATNTPSNTTSRYFQFGVAAGISVDYFLRFVQHP